MKPVIVIETVFFAALEQKTPEDRRAYLDQACGEDPDLRRCVEKLLAAQPKVGDFMQAPASGLPATTEAPSSERPGALLGPYKLLHEIGEGGMGTVWMAEQEQPVKRRVALKVLKPGMDSKQVLARFEAERQALARMDHPNISKVLDAGATENGRPYFVMDLLNGVPITDFCNQSRLSPRERLELFIPVCHAIQHAHHKGIIHRDIKPSNVLVALSDGKPMPKVIDFGVAKAIAEPLTDKTLFTRHGQVVGTYEYMSPEQATLDALDVDTRSDVYALGVLLYELLTGTTPLEKDRLRQAGFPEMLHLIREEEPPRPSTRLTSSPGMLATVAAYQKTDSQKLPKLVRGELDWIVMKCLEKDRNRRFASANGLALDIERYLKDEPVTACPPSAAYRLRKFARKHKVAFATGTAIAAALVVGIALAAWQAIRATKAEYQAERDRDAAIAAGKETGDQRDRTSAALSQLERHQEEMRPNQYAWDMQILPLTWEAGNVAEARRLLERQPQNLRGFEWHYWDRQTHTELRSIPLKIPAERGSTQGWLFSGDGSRIALIQRDVVTVWHVASQKELLSYSIPLDPPDESAGTAQQPMVADSGFSSLSRDGKRLLVLSRHRSFVDPFSRISSRVTGRVHVVDVDSGKELFDSRKASNPTPTQATLTPDGSRLFTQLPALRSEGNFTTIKAWDLDAGGKELFSIESAFLTECSPDGSRIVGEAIIGEAGGLKTKVWDAANGKELFSWDGRRRLQYSLDGSLLVGSVVVGENPDRRTVLKVFKTVTGEELASIPLAAAVPRAASGTRVSGRTVEPALQIVVSPDSTRLAVRRSLTVPQSGDSRYEWQIFNLKTQTLLFTLEAPERAAGPGGGRLATPRGRPAGQVGAATPFFTPDATQFVCADDNVIRTFDATTGRPLQTLRGHDSPVADYVLSPDGRRLHSVEAVGTLKEWALYPAGPVRIRTDRADDGFRTVFALSGDGACLAAAGSSADGGRVEVCKVAGKGSKLLKTPPLPGQPEARQVFAIPKLSADGKRVALARALAPAPSRFGPSATKEPAQPPKTVPGHLTVWDVASEKVLFEFVGPLAPVPAVGMMALAPDGDRVAVIVREKEGKEPLSIKMFDIETRAERQTIPLSDEVVAVYGLCFRPDGRRLVAITASRLPGQSDANAPTIRLTVWGVAEGKQLYAVEVDGTLPPTLAWSPDGTRLASSRSLLTAQMTLYKAATGEVDVPLSTADRGGVIAPGSTPVFSPDGRRIACTMRVRGGTNAVRVWDTASGKELLALPAPSPVYGGFPVDAGPLAFTPDGHRLLRATRERVRFEPANPDGIHPERSSTITVQRWDATPRLHEPMK